LPQGIVAIALSFDVVPLATSHVEECPDIGPACASTPKPAPYTHHLDNLAYGATLDAQYGVTPWLTVAATIPYRFMTTRVRYTDLAGNAYTPSPSDTHHRNETIAGLGDPTLAFVVGRAFARLGVSIRVGAMWPFGRTLDVNPFVAGDEGIPHEHTQFGAGSVRPIVGTSLAYDFGRVGVDAFMQATLAIAANAIGYEPGQRLTAGAHVSSTFGASSVRIAAGVELLHESAESWSGVVEQDGNLGRTDVVVALLGRWSPWSRWSVFGALKVPVIVDAVGAQLSYPFAAQLGIATAWGA
jgi:hypothetical protein